MHQGTKLTGLYRLDTQRWLLDTGYCWSLPETVWRIIICAYNPIRYCTRDYTNTNANTKYSVYKYMYVCYSICMVTMLQALDHCTLTTATKLTFSQATSTKSMALRFVRCCFIFSHFPFYKLHIAIYLYAFQFFPFAMHSNSGFRPFRLCGVAWRGMSFNKQNSQNSAKIKSTTKARARVAKPKLYIWTPVLCGGVSGGGCGWAAAGAWVAHLAADKAAWTRSIYSYMHLC
ncbi:unnamed protein product, partial [Ceratitis capitata]